jgi:hemoglobin-like flavoprotein
MTAVSQLGRGPCDRVAERIAFVGHDAVPPVSDISILLMTPDQIRLIRSSWSTIAKDADAFTSRFYAHLFVIDDSAARLFTGVDMPAQRRKIAQTFGVLVDSLDNLESVIPAVAALGSRHAGYGVEARHFESVGQALVLTMAETLGDGFTPAVRDAWVTVYTGVVSVMGPELNRDKPASAQTA